MPKGRQSEAKFCDAVQAELEAAGWLVIREIRANGGRVDILAFRPEHAQIIEAKVDPSLGEVRRAVSQLRQYAVRFPVGRLTFAAPQPPENSALGYLGRAGVALHGTDADTDALGLPGHIRDGGWWQTTRAEPWICFRCGWETPDPPAVAAYCSDVDRGLSDRRWARYGWLVWRECGRCGYATGGTGNEAFATDEEVREWGGKLRPWKAISQ